MKTFCHFLPRTNTLLPFSQEQKLLQCLGSHEECVSWYAVWCNCFHQFLTHNFTKLHKILTFEFHLNNIQTDKNLEIAGNVYMEYNKRDFKKYINLGHNLEI